MLASQKPRLSVEPTHPALPCSLWDPEEPVVQGLPSSWNERKSTPLRHGILVLALLPTSCGPWACLMVLKLGYILESPGLHPERFRKKKKKKKIT